MFAFLYGFVVLINLLQTPYAKQNTYCAPSACGSIRNISYPFRLRNDPQHCGNSDYELVCENNNTFLYVYNSHKYHVKAINYNNFTIRLADPSVTENNTCSLPQNSQNYFLYPYSKKYPYSMEYPFSIYSYDRRVPLARPITFLSCEHPVNYSLYIKEDLCAKGKNDSATRIAYIKSGNLSASDVGEMCTINLVVMVSSLLTENSISLPQIHASLVYGFEISWFGVFCGVSRCLLYTEAYCQWNGKKAVCQNIDLGFIYFGVLEPFSSVILWILVSMTLITGINLAAKIVFGLPLLLLLLIYKFQRRHFSMFDVIEVFLQNNNKLAPIRYSYSEIKKMTRGFKEKLGQGGYGSVYKGKLRSGHYVAVKVLSKRSENNRNFVNEVSTIGRIHHMNVVKLVGYCVERSKRALVYDFMPNGSLEKYIFNEETTESLSWQRKLNIATGVAQGIQYLHRGCEIQILHFDIKPHNILLDENFTPKISDFGLAKFYSTENNTVSITAARGTIGYVAPELINRSIGGVSYKADVYSFGMLLMGMVGLNRDLVPNVENSSEYFPYWIYSHLDQWKDVEIGNESEIDSSDDDEKITRKMAIVALWCIQMSPYDRPPMSRVVEMLECEVELLKVPPRTSPLSQILPTKGNTWRSDSMIFLGDDHSNNQHI